MTWEIVVEAARAIYSAALVLFGFAILLGLWRVRPYVAPGLALLRDGAEAARLALVWLRGQVQQAEDAAATRAATARIEATTRETARQVDAIARKLGAE